MKLIIPMAGKGTRLRPHTHVTPKPLLPVVGASMVERIIRTFIDVLPRKLEDAVFILGDFPPEVKTQLTDICARFDVQAHFAYQEKALGTAHAVYCAAEHLEGEGIVVFADTLFFMEPGVDFESADALVWVKYVEDPRRFGVVVKKNGQITDFVEKPAELISHDAIIGIYYVKDLAILRGEIEYVLSHQLTGPGGEFHITDAFDRMLKSGLVFKTASVTEWLDCGTVPALMETTRFILDREQGSLRQGEVEDSVIIEPVFIGPGARVVRSVVGPYVSIEPGAEVHDAVVRNSIVFSHASVREAILEASLIGQHAEVNGQARTLNIGDHAAAGPAG